MKNERDSRSDGLTSGVPGVTLKEMPRPGTNGSDPGMGQMVKLTEWEREPSVRTLQEDLEASRGAHDAHVRRVRHWNDLRNVTGSAKPKKIEGRSSVQPKLIRRQAEWRYSALSEPFLSSQDIIDVKPATFEDVPVARQNKILLNWQFRTKINKVRFIDEYVRTAVDEGSVIVRLGWNRQTRMKQVEKPVYQFLSIVDPAQLEQFNQFAALKSQNPRGFKELPEEVQAAVEFAEANQVPVMAQVIGTQMVEEEEIVVNQPTLDFVDPENIYIDPSCGGDMDKAKFAIVSFETSKAELLADGRYTNLNQINWSGAEVLNQPDHATQTPTDFNFKDDLRKRIVAYEYWGFYDIDGSETLTPIVATWVGNTMIRMEENPFPDQKLPFVWVSYLPVKRQLAGEPDAEMLEDNQAITGAVTRGILDLMGRSANSQQGIAKGFLDVVNQRRFEKGLDYQFNPGNGDPRVSLHMHQYPEIPQSAMTMVQLQNFEAESLTGVKAFSGGLSGEAYGDVAAGIKGMLDAAAKREMNILRRLAKGICDIAIKMAAMNAVFLSEEETVRVTNEEFVVIKREDLKGTFDIVVDINTAEVDMARARDLEFMLQTMGPDMDPGMARMILANIAELKRMPDLARQIRDYQPQPDPFEEQMKQLELQMKQLEIAKLQSEVNKNNALANKAETEADQNNLDFVEQESGTKHVRELEKQAEQGRQNQDMAVTKALLEKRKPEETRPDIEAAVGFNALTDRVGGAGTGIFPGA